MFTVLQKLECVLCLKIEQQPEVLILSVVRKFGIKTLSSLIHTEAVVVVRCYFGLPIQRS
jgi:hypothetical protein